VVEVRRLLSGARVAALASRIGAEAEPAGHQAATTSATGLDHPAAALITEIHGEFLDVVPFPDPLRKMCYERCPAKVWRRPEAGGRQISDSFRGWPLNAA
jgi:hypothetical protein